MGREQAVGGSYVKPPEPEKPKATNPVKTLYLGWDLIGKIDRLSKEWGLTPSAVVRWLIRQGLETGKEPPEETRRVV